MIRITLLWLVVLALTVLAARDWFRALCGLILLMGVSEHPDFPKTVLGVQGLNPWNFLLLCILLSWAASRRREGLAWDLPRHVAVLLLLYLGVILAGTARMLADRTNIEAATTAELVSENLVNTVKFVIPGLLLFDGCRSAERLRIAIASVLGVYLILALQVIKWMPPASLVSGVELTTRSRKVLVNEVGYHAVNLSMLLAGASWAVYAARDLTASALQRRAVTAAAIALVYAQALTAGRMGYVTWAVVGASFGLLRWRRILLVLPALAIAVCLVAPAAAERMQQGIGGTDAFFGVEAETSDYEVTSGRTLIWPFVLDKIAEAPLLGHGRLAMARTGLADRLEKELHESFPHPHNAWLEMLLDNGVVGLALVLPFYLVVLARAGSLFRDARSPAFTAAGGTALALVLAFLVAGFGSQTFYPREGAVGMWCAIGLMLRVSLERARAGGEPFASPSTLGLRATGICRGQLPSGTTSAEGAEYRRARGGLCALCGPLRPLRS